MIRSLTQNTIEIRRIRKSFTPKTDYLEANSVILSVFGSLFTPMFLTAMIMLNNLRVEGPMANFVRLESIDDSKIYLKLHFVF